MKKNKSIAYLFLFLIIINVFSPLVSVKAEINGSYAESTVYINTTDEKEGSSQVLQWIGQIVYTLASGIETIAGKIISLFSGSDAFPWADKIIFNTIPILDVNFINPAKGSFLRGTDGQFTTIGDMIRNTYFSIFSIAFGFLTLLIAVMAIKLATTSIASKKATYKEGITQLLICIALLFGLHYLLAGVFYVNEKLVEVASTLMTDILTSDPDLAKRISGMSDKSNKAIVTNFTNQAGKECFLASIPIIGTLYKGLINCLHAVGQFFSDIWNWFTGKKDEQKEITKEQLGEIYPHKSKFIEEIHKNDKTVNVAAYLLKNKTYRKEYLQWVKGNDTNSFSSAGLGGMARNILINVNDVFGIADTGYKALRTLYTSVALVTFQRDDPNKKRPFESITRETMAANSGDESYLTKESGAITATNDKGETETIKDDSGNTINIEDNDMSTSSDYYCDKIKSTKQYKEYISNIEKEIDKLQSMSKEERESKNLKDNDVNAQVISYKLDRIYAEAYYKYVYEGDDKYEPTAEDLISEVGTFFKNSSWVVDTQKGAWSPTSINFLNAMLYAVFIGQSLVFFIAYCKRFFYVIILSLMGPVAIVFDFAKGIMNSL